MRMEFDEDCLNDGLVKLIHNDEVIYWNITAFDKKGFQAGYDVFKHINQYWAHMEPVTREKVFITFKKIKNVFDDVFNIYLLIEALLPLVQELTDEHDVDKILSWMSFHSDITFSYNLAEIYVASDDRPSTPEKTYLKQDYYELLAMTIVLRTMIPIWGQFIYITKRETTTRFKEYYAFQLLAHTKIINSKPMEKLKVYVINNIQSDKPIYDSIINGISSENYPIWLLSKVVINKLCVGDISGVNVASSLVTFLWNFINHKINNANSGSFNTMVKNKEFESGDVNNDHNASRLEGYKVKTELPLGDIVILEHYMDDPVNVALQLKPSVNLELLNYFLENVKLLNNEQIWKPQVAITQYVLKPVISPRGLVHLSKKQVINAIGIAQTLLWESNHKTLACLISAVATDNNDEMSVSGIDSRSKIPKPLMDELNVWYPFNKINSQRKKGKVGNVIVSAIDELTQLFSQRDWLLTIKDEFILEATGKNNTRRFSCPQDIKILLAKLILELVKSR